MGQRTRTAECLNTAGEGVPDKECEGTRPETSESCDMGVCAKGWYHTAWSEEVMSSFLSFFLSLFFFCKKVNIIFLQKT